jgi:hypothetical protein
MSTINIHFHKDSNPDITIYNNDYSESESESESETESDSETESETLDDPKPYHGDGFRVYFDTHKDREFFMRAFGFN